MHYDCILEPELSRWGGPIAFPNLGKPKFYDIIVAIKTAALMRPQLMESRRAVAVAPLLPFQRNPFLKCQRFSRWATFLGPSATGVGV